MIEKTIKDLTIKEIIEDLEYYLKQAQIMSPPFVDETFTIINKYIKELKDREIDVKGEKNE